MEITDQKNIVKRIAKIWKGNLDIKSDTRRERMLAYRYALEMCGLTLNEIIALGNAENLDAAVDELFSKT